MEEQLKDTAKEVMNKTTDYSGSKTRKVGKGILGIVIVILLGALGLETTNNDWDIGKIMSGSSMQDAKVMRDKQGNVVTEGGKYTDEYNCADFITQVEAQTFFVKAGGKSKDTNRLDGNSDGVACQDLPKGQ